MPHNATAQFGAPAAVMPDNGLCLAGVHPDAPGKIWMPTLFEDELLEGASG